MLFHQERQSLFYVLRGGDIWRHTNHAPKVRSIHRFLLRKWCPILLFHHVQGFRWRAFRHGSVEEIEEFDRSVGTRKRQVSFMCNFMVLDPFDVNIGSWQVLELFVLRNEPIA